MALCYVVVVCLVIFNLAVGTIYTVTADVVMIIKSKAYHTVFLQHFTVTYSSDNPS